MRPKTKHPTPKPTDLPPDVRVGDLKWPKPGEGLGWEKMKKLGIEHNSFTFYHVTSFGWVLTTLHISNPSSRSSSTTARSYGVKLDGSVVRVGKGPHVTKEITVYLSKDNLERLTKYIELWKKGMGRAGEIRDRISSRQAQGQLMRVEGRSHWYWNT